MNSGKKDKAEGKDKIGKREFTRRPPCHPWGDYAEEIIPLLLVLRRSETETSWLAGGCDAGEYCGETGENCEAGVLSTCEPGETKQQCLNSFES